MSMKLKELIRAVRASKTAAAERSVVSQELALIRTAFKEEQLEYRNRNVAKLLFVHMLGYPGHFGQMECIKLITSNDFSDKRIGYLGLMLLLTEKEEVLMLVTNSLKVDLNAQNPFVVGLALTTVGNLATTDIARDLMMDVDKHLSSGNPYLRKKAALCTIRVLKKNPEHVEDFVDKIVGILKDRHHGVLLSGIQLMTSIICFDQKAYAPLFVRVIPSLVRLLKNLISVGYSPDHDVSGMTNPFLQVKILKLLRLLGEFGGTDDATEAMNDILTQVASTTDTSKNVGNSILYECVNTIMAVQPEQGLQVLAVNVLGRFLLNRDNNIRYVALNTLGRVVEHEISVVQRHRNTIVDCLKDPDNSIRQRALELIYKLVNEENVSNLTVELLNYLVVAPSEYRPTLCSKVAEVIDKFGSNFYWKVETLLSMLGIAGDSNSNFSDDLTCAAVIYIGQCPEYQGYIVHYLFSALNSDISNPVLTQSGLVKIGVWCIGEYGDMLTKYWPNITTKDGKEIIERHPVALDEAVNLIGKVLTHHSSNSMTKSYCVTALAKLSGRDFLSIEEQTKAENLISYFDSSINVDLQQRSYELTQLLSSNWSEVREVALERIPAIDESSLKERKARKLLKKSSTEFDDNLFDNADENISQVERENDGNSLDLSRQKNQIDLLDLDDIFGKENGENAQNVPAKSSNFEANNLDLLADIFSSKATLAVSSEKSSDLLVGDSNVFDSAPTKPANPSFLAFEKGSLSVKFELLKEDLNAPASTKITAKFYNSGFEPLEKFVFQAAVPKYITMRLLPATANMIPTGNQEVEQIIMVTNEAYGTKDLMMRIKVSYTENGESVQEMVQISNFPQGY